MWSQHPDYLEDFLYLSQKVNAEKDIQHQLKSASAAFGQLSSHVLNDHVLRTQTFHLSGYCPYFVLI